MSVLENAKRIFAARQRHEMDMPEWADENGKPTRVYFKTANPACIDKATFEAKGKSLEMCARLICLVAQDADGKLLFGSMDHADLIVSTDAKALDRLAAAMMRDAEIKTEDAIKN
jgi:hypothetical protein